MVSAAAAVMIAVLDSVTLWSMDDWWIQLRPGESMGSSIQEPVATRPCRDTMFARVRWTSASGKLFYFPIQWSSSDAGHAKYDFSGFHPEIISSPIHGTIYPYWLLIHHSMLRRPDLASIWICCRIIPYIFTCKKGYASTIEEKWGTSDTSRIELNTLLSAIWIAAPSPLIWSDQVHVGKVSIEPGSCWKSDQRSGINILGLEMNWLNHGTPRINWHIQQVGRTRR